MILNECHYEHFKAASLNPNSWHGTSPASWFSWIQRQKDVNCSSYSASGALPGQQLSRADLFAIVEDSNFDTLSCCISILAWGGMNRKYGADALSMYSNWIHVAEDIRKGLLDRGQAYEKFATLREKSMIRGMGPAYFTKLIFFLSPNTLPRGLIMDQWTSASVNLLFDRKIVQTKLQKTRQKNGMVKLSEFVTDDNTKENYLNFCKCVELIATRLNKDPATIEEMLFSEGRGKINWRKYVVDQRSFGCK